MKNKKTVFYHEPIVWTKGIPLEQFFETAQGFGQDYVIYVQDSEGGNKDIMACAKRDLVKCFEGFSAKCLFGRIQPLIIALEYGFDDAEFTKDIKKY